MKLQQQKMEQQTDAAQKVNTLKAAIAFLLLQEPLLGIVTEMYMKNAGPDGTALLEQSIL